MPCPCTCDRVTGPVFTSGQCRPCWLYRYSPKYRAKWDGEPTPPAPPPAPAPPPPVPCFYAGDVIGVQQGVSLGLPKPHRRWQECQNPRRPFPLAATQVRDRRGYVCPCQGCGPKCPGYVSGEEVDPTAATPLPRVLTWAYGVTTVPSRRETLFPRTLKSLEDAGFDSPRVFLDGATHADGARYEGEFGLPVTTRTGSNVRTAGNWVLSLYELYIRDPHVDRYALFQDDLVTCRGLRLYLDHAPYPADGYLNLYTFPQNQSLRPKDPDWRGGFYPANQLGKGAVALVFDRDCVVKLLSSEHLAVRPQDKDRGHKSIDGGIVTALKKAGKKEYVHDPSLVQHTGMQSSMGNRQQPLAPSFPGETWDATFLLARPV